MNREIKFRVWDKETEQMCGVQFFTMDFEMCQIVPLSDPTNDDKVLSRKFKDVEAMQFTGLKDKNGKEIFEGDIIAAKLNTPYLQRVGWEGEPDVIAEIFWSFAGFELRATNGKDSRYCDMLDFVRDNQDDLLMMECTESEIIGNVWENPELLTNI